jgi:hypothetical protein
VEILNDSNSAIAQFAYDALGRRIEKKDLVNSDHPRRHYYNNNWQALCEYDGSNTFKYSFAYGNYIDETLFMYRYLHPSRAAGNGGNTWNFKVNLIVCQNRET